MIDFKLFNRNNYYMSLNMLIFIAKIEEIHWLSKGLKKYFRNNEHIIEIFYTFMVHVCSLWRWESVSGELHRRGDSPLSNILSRQRPPDAQERHKGHKGTKHKKEGSLPHISRWRDPSRKNGGYLLSHSYAVPSARPGLTALFGMGRGGTPAL